ncbi:MAG: hypothetical protein P0Y65_17030 [Candidatus Devosia phytovorans]|uniref:Uncharacterized protein n=1 Tax=Candidatus Devosia phytovorans TaxID=3121372 RepID=A0AAJ6AZJ5_9HYPH|nr:hypothetical protein [Devosia sp.]WEK03876.1 MAG: hypothetical protein P0Y65_17030 [Devosia sp.]
MTVALELTNPAGIVLYPDQKAARFHHERKSLAKRARAIIRAHYGIVETAPDSLLIHIVTSAGFSRDDLAWLRVMRGGKMINILVVPSRIWHNPESMALVFKARRDATTSGLRCLLVPQRWLRGENRSAAANLIARCSEHETSDIERRAVTEHIASYGRATVGTCAEILSRNDDPFGAVLAMHACGVIRIDLSRRIAPDSWVKLGLRN